MHCRNAFGTVVFREHNLLIKDQVTIFIWKKIVQTFEFFCSTEARRTVHMQRRVL